jgi:hypothetical protein
VSPDDARHGERRGYLAGCREDCCRNPHLRYQKRSTLRRHREGSQIVPAADVTARIEWWADRGVAANALSIAANLGCGTLAELIAGERHVCLQTTRRALLNVTWDDLPPTALCNARITLARIDSLMAAGHPLAWICARTVGLSPGGRWRRQARVTISLARNVLATYEAAPLDGTSKITLVKARNRGIYHPLGWDDPGELAMPHDWTPPTSQPDRIDQTTIDEAAIVRVMAGHPKPRRLTQAEAAEICRRGRVQGMSDRQIAQRYGLKPERYPREEVA